MNPTVKQIIKVVVSASALGAVGYYAPAALPVVQQLLTAIFGG